MKDTTAKLLTKNILCKKFTQINCRDFGIRKKINIFEGTTIKGYFIVVFSIKKKSKVTQKEILIYEEILKNIKSRMDKNFKIKVLIIDAPLCSKAKLLAKELKWKIIDS